MNKLVTKQFSENDGLIWKNFRLDSLKHSPESFGSSYDEELICPDIDFKNGLRTSDIFGVFIDAALISCVEFFLGDSEKTKQRGFTGSFGHG